MSRSLPDQVTLDLDLDDDVDDDALRHHVAARLRVAPEALPPVRLRKRSVDARGDRVRFHLVVDLGEAPPHDLGAPHPREVRGEARVVIVGDGPAGLFCAYELARAWHRLHRRRPRQAGAAAPPRPGRR